MKNNTENWLNDAAPDADVQQALVVFQGPLQVNDRDFRALLAEIDDNSPGLLGADEAFAVEDDYPGFGDLSDLADTMELSEGLGFEEHMSEFGERAVIIFLVVYNIGKVLVVAGSVAWVCPGSVQQKIIAAKIAVLATVGFAHSLYPLAALLIRRAYKSRQKRLKSSQEP